jgi:hypothetical protein
MPHLRVTFDQATPEKPHSIRSERLEEHPLFHTFDKDFFDAHRLPEQAITYRDGTGHVEGKNLNFLIENLLQEVAAGKKRFTDFTVLGAKNFNKRHQYGLLILKFRDYPFVLKLFIETPASFVDPYTKGLESMCFFFMGGGVNRHMMGFTRIKNLESIKEKIATDQSWASRIDVPRKWFWLPNSARWLKLEGENIAFPGHQVNTSIPAMYGIVADAVDAVRKFSILNSQDKKTAIELSDFLEMLVDAHIDNFMIEKETNKIVIVDTEYFPMLVGMKEGPGFKNYFDYFSKLTFKFLRDTFGYTKSERQALRSCRFSSSSPTDLNQSIILFADSRTQTNRPPCCGQKKKTT